MTFFLNFIKENKMCILLFKTMLEYCAWTGCFVCERIAIVVVDIDK